MRVRLKKRGQKEPSEKNERKREKGQCDYPFPCLCFEVAPCFHIESLLCCHFHILVGIFHYKTWLVYSDDGLPQMPEVFEQASWMHTHLVFSLSFHTLITLSASIAWQPLLLALTSIDGHIHSPLISRVDVRLSSFFVFSILISTTAFYSTHSAISMACAHVLRGVEKAKAH